MARSFSSIDTAPVEERIADLRRKVEALMQEQVNPVVSRATSRAQHLAHRASDTARHEADQVAGVLRDRPFTAVAVAVGVGFLLAQLFRR